LTFTNSNNTLEDGSSTVNAPQPALDLSNFLLSDIEVALDNEYKVIKIDDTSEEDQYKRKGKGKMANRPAGQ